MYPALRDKDLSAGTIRVSWQHLLSIVTSPVSGRRITRPDQSTLLASSASTAPP